MEPRYSTDALLNLAAENARTADLSGRQFEVALAGMYAALATAQAVADLVDVMAQVAHELARVNR